jgi:hypothetical protein
MCPAFAPFYPIADEDSILPSYFFCNILFNLYTLDFNLQPIMLTVLSKLPASDLNYGSKFALNILNKFKNFQSVGALYLFVQARYKDYRPLRGLNYDL